MSVLDLDYSFNSERPHVLVDASGKYLLSYSDSIGPAIVLSLSAVQNPLTNIFELASVDAPPGVIVSVTASSTLKRVIIATIVGTIATITLYQFVDNFTSLVEVSSRNVGNVQGVFNVLWSLSDRQYATISYTDGVLIYLEVIDTTSPSLASVASTNQVIAYGNRFILFKRGNNYHIATSSTVSPFGVYIYCVDFCDRTITIKSYYQLSVASRTIEVTVCEEDVLIANTTVQPANLYYQEPYPGGVEVPSVQGLSEASIQLFSFSHKLRLVDDVVTNTPGGYALGFIGNNYLLASVVPAGNGSSYAQLLQFKIDCGLQLLDSKQILSEGAQLSVSKRLVVASGQSDPTIGVYGVQLFTVL